MLRSVYPEFPWQPWRFGQTQRNFIEKLMKSKKKINYFVAKKLHLDDKMQREFLNFLKNQEMLTNYEDLLNITAIQLHKYISTMRYDH